MMSSSVSFFKENHASSLLDKKKERWLSQKVTKLEEKDKKIGKLFAFFAKASGIFGVLSLLTVFFMPALLMKTVLMVTIVFMFLTMFSAMFGAYNDVGRNHFKSLSNGSVSDPLLANIKKSLRTRSALAKNDHILQQEILCIQEQDLSKYQTTFLEAFFEKLKKENDELLEEEVVIILENKSPISLSIKELKNKERVELDQPIPSYLKF